jgi:hypothetical protein
MIEFTSHDVRKGGSYMAWQNAPALNKLTASQQGGNRGAQLWGVDFKGTLHTIYQKTPGGDWSNWMGPDWAGPGYPKQVYELAATQQNDGRVMLFVLDVKQDLWCISQHSPGGDWTGWQRPEWNGMRSGDLTKLCAAPHGSKGFGQLWALTGDGSIVGNHQARQDGPWFQGWYDWQTTPENSKFIEITAARQGNGHTALWGLDTKRQLWYMEQTAGDADPPGGWGPWKGPNWEGAPKLRNIAACQGKEGALIWGIGEDEWRIFHNWQLGPGSNKWGGWQIGDWMNGPFSYELTAAGQNNGCAQVWAISLQQVLHSIAQIPPSCGWKMSWNPPRRRPHNS